MHRIKTVLHWLVYCLMMAGTGVSAWMLYFRKTTVSWARSTPLEQHLLTATLLLLLIICILSLVLLVYFDSYDQDTGHSQLVDVGASAPRLSAISQPKTTDVEQQTTAARGYNLSNEAVVMLTCVLSCIIRNSRKELVAHIKKSKAILALHELGSDSGMQGFSLVNGKPEPTSMDELVVGIRGQLAELEQALRDFDDPEGTNRILLGILDELRPNYELIKSSPDYFRELIEATRLKEDCIV